MSRFQHTLALAFVCLMLAPGTSSAETPAPLRPELERFRVTIQKDVARVRKVIEGKLARNAVSKERCAAIRRIMNHEIGTVQAALDEALQDDKLTVREAEQVRMLTRHLRGRIKKKIQEEKEQRQKEATSTSRPGPEPTKGEAAAARPAKPTRAEPAPAAPPSSKPKPSDLRPEPYPLPGPAANP